MSTCRVKHYDQVFRLVARALASGGVRKSAFRTEWNISGNCTNPHLTEIYGRDKVEGDKYLVVRGRGRHPLQLDLLTRCRRCDNCRRVRQNLWKHRAKNEIRASSRTWFCTLTFAPERVARATSVLRLAASKQGEDWDAFPEARRFSSLASELGSEVTLFFKRVRITGVPLRYLCVVEAHQSGVPHFHALIHERHPAKPVRYAVLKDKWHGGFSQFRLITDFAEAGYVSKYLSKSALARVRASARYGATPPDVIGMFEAQADNTPVKLDPKGDTLS